MTVRIAACCIAVLLVFAASLSAQEGAKARLGLPLAGCDSSAAVFASPSTDQNSAASPSLLSPLPSDRAMVLPASQGTQENARLEGLKFH